MREDQPEYAEPVDPWATAEAAAVSAGHLPPTVAQWQPAGGARRSRKGLWAGLAAATVLVVAGAATGLVLWLRPAHPPIDFRPLTDPVRIAAPIPVSSTFAATALRDGRAYFASGDSDGRLAVVAADAGTGTVAWRNQELSGTWESFAAVPGAVVLRTRLDSVTSTRRLMVLDPDSGRLAWQRPLGADDEIVLAGGAAVLVDRTENRVVGLSIRDGKVAWERRSPTTPSGSGSTTVVAVTTAADLAGPASTGGVPFAAAWEDGRIVQLGADRSAQVLDAATGKLVAGPRQNVADPGGMLLAHDGRLIVAESDAGSRIMAYDLEALDGEPRTLFTPPTDARLELLTACGTDRVCAVRETGFDDDTAHVVAIDAADSGLLWERAAPGTEALLPVGDAVLAAGEQVTLLDADGRVAWTRDGVAGRLDAGNVLLFSKDLSGSADDPALTGVPVGEDAVPLGALAGVRSATCSWDTAHLACVAAEDFVLQTFGA